MFFCPLSPALLGLPFLEVTYVIDCAVYCHVIVVTGNVEGTGKFYGPLVKKRIQNEWSVVSLLFKAVLLCYI